MPLYLASSLAIVANAATPDEVAKGNIPGFLNSWNGNPPRPSDFLTATFCYCGTKNDIHLANRTEKAHIFQYEYFNSHSNTTYLVEYLCEASADRVSPGCLENRNIDHGRHGAKSCRTWQRDPNNGRGKHDQFCYAAADVNNPRGEDAVVFNGQRRELGASGGQRPVHQPADVVEKACTSLCPMFTGLHMLDDTKLAPNRMTVYKDLDDMCDHCK